MVGGVSGWVADLLKNLPQFRFSVVCLVPYRGYFRKYVYSLPENIIGLKELYIQDYAVKKRLGRARRGKVYSSILNFHKRIKEGGINEIENIECVIHKISQEKIFYSKESFKFVLDFYSRYFLDGPFVDYFWTWRFTHLHLYNILRFELPEASTYHSVTTGYAGFLGALAKIRNGAPFLITEHGIYARERRMEIVQADWLNLPQAKKNHRHSLKVNHLKQLWMNIFQDLGRVTYSYADEVITVCDYNREMQIELGAPPEKTKVINNGIEVKKYHIKRESRPHPSVGFVGRIVPIKDIKTLVKSARIVLNELPKTQFYIIGPDDEDPDYGEECKLLCKILDLEKKVIFTGKQDALEYYKFMDVLVLTSISEAQPLVILEVHACGIPAVATDVGGCREMLEGRDEADKALGRSGLITPPAQPNETAKAIITLLKDDKLRQKMGEAGRQRVIRYYDKNTLWRNYEELYEGYIRKAKWQESD